MSLLNIEPQAIWNNFAQLNTVPRPSKKEEKVIAFIKDFGEKLGLPTTVDAVGNVIISKPASAGMEDRKPIVLQSHLDMVCQKNNDVNFDFDTQGIQMEVVDGWVKANGTTLGADNGLGVATIMTILESKDIPHPALEALFTIDEETGMTGALGLQAGQLNGEILLNLDTEEDDEIGIGCAGGVDVSAYKTYSLNAGKGNCVKITVKGLQGGHSGMDIHKGLGNANVILGRLLYAGCDSGLQVCAIDGGGLRNAIPREASATVSVSDLNKFLEAINLIKEDILKEFATVDKGLQIIIEKTDCSLQSLSAADSCQLVHVLKAAHNGVYRMSPDVAGLVEASNNIARVELKDGNLKILCLSRSSVESTKTAVVEQLSSVFQLADMKVELSGAYPGWKPNPDSVIVQVMEQIFQTQFSAPAKVAACHAGLECGIIGAHYPKMEMVSFGPTIKGAHSPEERANVASVQKFWKFLQEILRQIPKK